MSEKRSICIAGFGVMGASIAQSLKKRDPECYVCALIRKKEDISEIQSLGFVDDVSIDPEEVIPQSDIVVLCIPPWALIPYIKKINPCFTEGTVVTDIASVKADIAAKAQQVISKNAVFISSHPMAGTEKTGFRNFVSDLFSGAACIITPGEDIDSKSIVIIKEFWESIDMRVLVMSFDEHDSSVGFVSHLPHALADILMLLLAAEKKKRYPWLYDISGGSFRDMTRIAEGSPKLWSQIFNLNKHILLTQLDSFAEELKNFKNSLAEGEIEDYVNKAFQYKKESSEEKKNF